MHTFQVHFYPRVILDLLPNLAGHYKSYPAIPTKHRMSIDTVLSRPILFVYSITFSTAMKLGLYALEHNLSS